MKSNVRKVADSSRNDDNIVTISETTGSHSKKPLEKFSSFFADFSSNSSVHGIKYIGERQLKWPERTFWMFAFIISFIGCTLMIHKIFEKWQSTPVIVSFAEKSTSVWEIPFPAVTICPETKALKQNIDFTKGFLAVQSNYSLYNLTDNEMMNLAAITQICDPHLLISFNPIESELEPKNILPLLKNITMSLNETTFLCLWMNEVKPCNEIFTETITEEGFCYTFNVLSSSELFREEK